MSLFSVKDRLERSGEPDEVLDILEDLNRAKHLLRKAAQKSQCTPFELLEFSDEIEFKHLYNDCLELPKLFQLKSFPL